MNCKILHIITRGFRDNLKNGIIIDMELRSGKHEKK